MFMTQDEFAALDKYVTAKLLLLEQTRIGGLTFEDFLKRDHAIMLEAAKVLVK